MIFEKPSLRTHVEFCGGDDAAWRQRTVLRDEEVGLERASR